MPSTVFPRSNRYQLLLSVNLPDSRRIRLLTLMSLYSMIGFAAIHAVEPPEIGETADLADSVDSKNTRFNTGVQATDSDADKLGELILGLSSDNYRVRDRSQKKLVSMDQLAVGPLLECLDSGELETTERAIEIIARVGINSSPGNDGGAWLGLTRLMAGSGRIASAAADAVLDIKARRAAVAEDQLRRANIPIRRTNLTIQNQTSISMGRLPPRVLSLTSESKIDSEVVGWIRWLRDVAYFRLEGEACRDEIISEIAKVDRISGLILVDAELTPQAVELLSQRERPIIKLEFRYTKLNQEHLQWLKKVPIRSSLTLMGTGLTETDVTSLVESHPSIILDHRQGGFLGVSCNSNRSPCVITSVNAGGAAAEAGMQPLDVITAIDGETVEDFGDLVSVIRTKMVGDTVEIQYQRNDENQTLELQLKPLKDG
ncbi:MAG: PDZ domain-containing protein [Planctomycetota bacterium]